MDPDKIQAVFDDMLKDVEADDPMAKVVGSVDAATKLVQTKIAEDQAAMAATAPIGPPVKDDKSIPPPPKEGASGSTSSKPV